jgi:uncharacterized RDD family membrane protein YckC
MADGPQGSGLRGGMRRAVDGALDATVGRASHSVTEAAMDVTGATARQVIEGLEPYLIEEAIPRIVDGITPYLTDRLVPEVLEGITGFLVAASVTDIVDGVTAHLVAVTVPEVVDGVTPRLVADLLPKLLEDLRPYLEAELVPRIVEGLVPYIEESVAPELVDALLPKIRDEVAPELIEALMPRIEQEIAPQLVDALLPKIRAEVVPLILDDIIEDPRVRDLIREQSQGLFLDGLESIRENLADADVLVERFGRHLLRRPARPEADSALTLMLDAAGDADTTPARLTRDNLAQQRSAWQAMPVPPAPPGREFAHAGAVTRLVAFALDVTLVGWLVGQGLSALISLLDAVFDPAPGWLVVILTTIAASAIPVYLGVCWWLAGRTIGSWVVGTRVCTPDGRNPGLVRALVRAWAGVFGLLVWIVTGIFSLFDPKRRSWLDRLMNTEVRYRVPLDQQRRYIREAAHERQKAAKAAKVDVEPAAVDPTEP